MEAINPLNYFFIFDAPFLTGNGLLWDVLEGLRKQAFWLAAWKSYCVNR